jgi:hypothetical protein
MVPEIPNGLHVVFHEHKKRSPAAHYLPLEEGLSQASENTSQSLPRSNVVMCILAYAPNFSRKNNIAIGNRIENWARRQRMARRNMPNLLDHFDESSVFLL